MNDSKVKPKTQPGHFFPNFEILVPPEKPKYLPCNHTFYSQKPHKKRLVPLYLKLKEETEKLRQRVTELQKQIEALKGDEGN